MDITVNLFIYILLIHFLADFALQTHHQASNKYKGGLSLLSHVGTYSLVWLIATGIFDINFALKFSAITFIFHYITDLITSNLSKPLFENKDYHNGFVVVGFDQLLHYIQLLLTWYLLTI